eukprot:scaffold10152_cov88-Skeletonema_dohrnii-CCMP3373.AAC.1
MKEQSPREKCPMAAPQPSVRYIRQGSNSKHSSCGSSDVGGAGRQQQQRIASSITTAVDDVEGGALPLPTNNYYHPHRCNNGSNNKNYRDNNDGSSASPPHRMAVKTSSLHHKNHHHHHHHRIRSTSMPHQSTKQQRRSTSLVRKQTYTDHDTTGEDEENGMVFSKKQMSFEQQLLRRQPLPSFEQQQQQLPRKQLSFEQQLLHQKPLSPQKQLSFEQQLLQQEPPPFILPRSLSESLTPSRNDFPSSLSFEQQLLQQPELNANQLGGIGVVGLQPRHQQYDKRSSTQGSGHSVHNEQSSFADATANCDGSSVIYFRNDSGEKRKRCTSLPPPLVRWGSSGGGSVLSGNSAIRDGSMSPPTTRLGAVVRSGGGSSPARPPTPPSRGVENSSSLQKRPSKQLSFEQQLLRQQPLSPQKQLSLFEDEPLSFEQQQQPLPQKQLSFEQQLLQQEPPPPFILPRSLSESLTPSHNDFPSSLSIEQQLHRQPELNANQLGEIGVVFQPLRHNYDKRSSTHGSGHSVHNEQSSFADATANCDGSSVIYFRNDSGGSGSRRKRCTSLPPPPMIRWGSGGSVLSGNSAISDYSRAEEEGQIRMMSMSPPTTRLGVVRHDAVFGSGGGPSPACSPPPPPQGVDAASLHRNNNSRSTSMTPRTRSHSLIRKAPYNAASADMPLPHPQFTSPQSPPPPMNYYPPSLPTPSLLPQQTELGVDTITPEEYQRLEQESEMVRVRMREIEERIRDIELNRSNSQGGGGGGSRSTASGSGVAAPASALGGGAIIGDDKRKVDDTVDVSGGVESLIDFDESSYNSAGESEDSYYSDIEEEEEEEDDEDTIGALLSSASLLNNSKYRSDGDAEEDADTVGPLLSSTSLTEQPWEEDNEEGETETGIEIQGNRISVSDLNLCESTSSFISINTENENDASAALTESNSEDGGGEPSTDTTTSRRKVRFDDDEQYPPSRHPAEYVNSSPPPTQAQVTYIDDHMSRQSQDINDRRGGNEEFVKNQWQSSGCGSVGSTGSIGSHGSIVKSGDSVTSTTSSASNSSGDYHTLKTLLAAPKRNRSRVCNHSTISEEDEYCGGCGDTVTQNALAVIPSTQKKTTTEPINGGGVLSRHVEQLQNPLERKGTQNSTSSASSISTLLEHAPLEVHLTGLQKRRSKLLEMVEAQEQNSDDTKTQRSIEFSLFLMKDKLNQLQDLGVLGEEDEDEILKSGGTRRLLRKIKSEGTNHSEGREVSSYKRSSTATTPDSHYPQSS